MREPALAALAVALLAAAAPAQSARDLKVSDYQKQLLRHHVDCAQLYIDVATWARKNGLVPQSTTLFLRAKAVSQGKHPSADQLVSLMQTYGEAFWRKKQKKPARALVADCDRRVRDADRRTRKSHVRVAQLALGIDDEKSAREHCHSAMAMGAEIAVDADGKCKLDGLELPARLADFLRDSSVADEAGKRTFEPVKGAADAPKLEGFRVHGDDRLLVRTDLSGERALQLHALGTALMPHLEERLDGSPTRQLVLLVFEKRVDYDAYLRARKLETPSAGLADYGGFRTLVCAEGLAEDDLHALVLHELTHLYFWGVAPAILPDWYAEGFAESFGGQGTFRFDGKTLAIGAPMVASRIAAMKAAPPTVRELLAFDAHAAFAVSRDHALLSYTAAWAFLRMLQAKDGKWRDDFEDWERECRSAVLGAPVIGPSGLPTAPAHGSAAAASQKFEAAFGKRMDELERAFRAFVEAL